jgi:hypothetical protein
VGFLDEAPRNPNIKAVVAIGSSVRSDVPSDDLDLVVLCGDRKSLRVGAPIEVDVRTFDLGTVPTAVEQGDDLLTWAVRFGEPLYDPQNVWGDLVRDWRHRLPLPDPLVARARAGDTAERLAAMREIGDPDAVLDLEVSYLTHLARALLSEAGVFPASRPELAAQLRAIGEEGVADQLSQVLAMRDVPKSIGTLA